MKKIHFLTLLAAMMLPLAAQAQSDCDAVAVTSMTPFFEGFNGTTLPQCWTTQGPGTWQVGVGDYSTATGCAEGTGNAHIQHSTTGNVTTLISPVLDLSSLSGAEITFQYVNRQWVSDIDFLVVLFRTSATDAWQTLDSITTAHSSWTAATYTVSSFSATCQLAFRYIDKYGYGVGIDDLRVGAPPTCFPVENLIASEINGHDVTLNWEDTINSGATYTITYWSNATDTAFTTSTSTSVTVTDLNSNTLYHFAITPTCTDGTGANAVTANFRTACDNAAIPFSDDFEGHSTGSAPSCWTVLSGNPRVNSSSSNAHAGSQYLHFSGSMSNAIALPPMDQPTGSLQVRFWTRPENFTNSSCGTFSVGYMTDVTIDSSFVELANWSYSEFSAYEEKEVPMIGAPDSARIVLRHNANSTYYYWYVDDLVVEPIPSCVRPVSVSAGNSTADGADIFIVGMEGASYRICWSDGTNSDSIDVSSDTYTLSGLAANTVYTVTVATICDDGTVTATRSTSFRTLVGDPISELPYICDFDENGSSADWALENNAPNGWYVGLPGGNNNTNGLFISNNNGTSASYTTNTSCVSYAYATFQLEAGEYSFSFDWKTTGESSYDFLRAAVAPAGTAMPNSGWTSSSVASGFTAVDGGYLNQSSSWQTKQGTFTVLTDGTYGFYFVWRNDNSSGSNPPACVDNFELSQVTCPAPYALSTDTVMPHEIDLRWTSLGEESEWMIVVGDSVIENVTTNPYTITGLEDDTQYRLAVYAVCDAGDTSFASSAITVRTPIACPWPTGFAATTSGDTVNFSWNDPTGSAWELVYGPEDFDIENGTVEYPSTNSYELTGLSTGFYEAYLRTNCGADNSVWVGPLDFSVGITIMNMATTGTDTLRSCAAIVYDNGGPNGSYSSNCNSTLVFLPETDDNYVVLSGTSRTEGSYDYLTIYEGIGTNGTVVWTDNGVSQTQTFGPFDAAAFTVVFVSDNSVTYSGFEIHADCIPAPACPRPTAVSAVATSGSDVTVDITGTNGGGYRIWWTDGTSVDSLDVYTNNTTISGLNASTTYTITVSSLCDDGSLTQSVSTTVHTQCAGGSCDVVIDMVDSYGDGWNGNAIVGYVGGSEVFTATISSGSSNSYTYSLCGTETLVLLWEEGSYSYETSFTISNGDFNLSDYGDNYDDGDTLGVINGCPNCPHPTNIVASDVTESSATISWTSNGSESEWIVSIDGGTPVTVTSPTYDAAGLAASSLHTVSVRALCSDTDTSSASTASFRTTCGAASLPFAEDFEAQATAETPSCWDNLNGNVYTQSSTSNTHGGSQYLRCSGSRVNMVALPPLTQEIDNVTLTFWTRPESATYSSCGTFSVGYITNVSDTSTFVSVETYSYNDTAFGSSTTTYSQKTVTFANAPAGARIAFRHNANATYYYWYVDDISVTSGQPDPNRYIVSAVSADATMGTAAVTPSGNVVEGTMVTFTATPNEGYLFTNWTSGATVVSTENPYTTSVISDLTLTANFEAYQPCTAPTNLTVTNVTHTGATLGWTNGEQDQNAWQIHITGLGYDNTIDVTTNPCTVSNLTNGVTYSVRVRAVCGETSWSDWSDSASFTTIVCETVTGVVVSNVTDSSAVISWTAPEGANTFEIEYGLRNFPQGGGYMKRNINATTYTLTGLNPNRDYDVYVRTVCEGTTTSLWSNVTHFQTRNSGTGIDDVASAAISLYPNPASNTVTLTGIEGVATVTVVDMNGRVVTTVETQPAASDITIDVTNMAQGAYFVRIVGEQVNAIRKLIVR